MANRIVTKALAGIEDLLLGTGEVTQSRGGNNKQITKIDAEGLIYENAETLRTRFGKKVEVLTNVVALQALTTTTAIETFVYLLGYTTAGDGGGGLFWLDSTDTTTVEDLNIVFNPDVLANGRWKRVDTDSYMSPDRGNADYTIQAFDFGIQQYNTALTANRTVTLPTTGLYKGKRLSVLRLAAGSFNLLIGSITTITGTGLVELQYTGTIWVILSEPASSSSEGDSFNGSFELDSNNDNIPDNWAVNELTSATIEIDKADQAHGLNSLKFLSGGNGGGTATSERFDVLSGSILPIQFTYKASAVDVLTKVDIKTYDKDGVLISTLSAYSEAAANSLVYTTKNVSVTIDALAVTVELVITGIDAASTTKGAGTTTHFDNLIFEGLLDEDTMSSDSDAFAPTQQSVKTYVDGKILHRGVSVSLSVSQDIVTATDTALDFDQEFYDTDLIHDNVTNNSRLTVPIGVTKVKLVSGVSFETDSIGVRKATIKKNGSSLAPLIGINMDALTATDPSLINLVSPVQIVVAGDYFELFVYQDSGTNKLVGGLATWFSMEIVE